MRRAGPLRLLRSFFLFLFKYLHPVFYFQGALILTFFLDLQIFLMFFQYGFELLLEFMAGERFCPCPAGEISDVPIGADNKKMTFFAGFSDDLLDHMVGIPVLRGKKDGEERFLETGEDQQFIWRSVKDNRYLCFFDFLEDMKLGGQLSAAAGSPQFIGPRETDEVVAVYKISHLIRDPLTEN